MSAGEEDEVHVALTGLKEAISGLETFESSLKRVGSAETPINTAFVGRLTEAKGEVVSLEASIRATIASLSQDLSKGIVPSGSLTAGLVQDVERSFGRIDALANELAKTFPAELKAIGNKDFLGTFDGLRQSIVETVKQAANEVRPLLKQIGLSGGLASGQLDPVLGKASGLNSSLTSRVKASELATSGLPEALDASRALAESAIKITRAIRRVDAHFGDTLTALDKAAAGEDPGVKFQGLLGRVQRTPDGLQVQDPIDGVLNVRRVDDAATRKRKLAFDAPPPPSVEEPVRIFRGERPEAASAGTAKGGDDVSGRIFTQDLSLAREYAGEFGKVFSTLVTEEGLGKAREAATQRQITDGLVVNEDVARAATLFTGDGAGGGKPPRPPVGGLGPSGIPDPPNEHGQFPDVLGITEAQAVELVRTRAENASRIETARGSGFNLPGFSGPGQSTAFDLKPVFAEDEGGKSHQTGQRQLERITAPADRQQVEARLGGDATTEAQRQKESAARAREDLFARENAGSLLQLGPAFSRERDSKEFVRRTGDDAGTSVKPGDATFNEDVAKANRELIAFQQKYGQELAAAAQAQAEENVQARELSGELTKQSQTISQDASGRSVTRSGPRAGQEFKADDVSVPTGLRQEALAALSASQLKYGQELSAAAQAQAEENVRVRELSGELKKQSQTISKDASTGRFVSRSGPRAGQEFATDDVSVPAGLRQDALTASVTTARKEESTAEKLKAQNAGLAGTFIGGFTSKGFENPGQGILPALVGTAGVLARYSVDGAAFGAVTLGIKSVLTSTEEYQAALIGLEEATRTAGVGQLDLQHGFAEGAKFGLSEAESIAVGTAAIKNYSSEIANGASATDIYNQAITDVGVNAIITGQKVDVSTKQLLQATNQFNLGSQGSSRINDAVLSASAHFNAAPDEVQKGVIASGDLANVAGFTPERLAATVAAVSSEGENPASISRTLARGGNTQFRQAITSLGVQDTGNTADELDRAAAAYAKLSDARRRDFVEQAGGARQAALLIALLKTNAEVNASVSESYKDVGTAQQKAVDIQNSAAGQIRQFFAELKNLGTELGKSGLADIFVLLFEVLKSGLGLLDGVAQAFNAITSQAGPFKDLVITALELTAALKVLSTLGGEGGAVGGAKSIINKIRNKQDVVSETEKAGASSAIPAATETAATEIGAAGNELAAVIQEVATKAAFAGGRLESPLAVRRIEREAEQALVPPVVRNGERVAEQTAVRDAEQSVEAGLGGAFATKAKAIGTALKTAVTNGSKFLLGGLTAGAELVAAFATSALGIVTIGIGAAIFAVKAYNKNQEIEKAVNAANQQFGSDDFSAKGLSDSATAEAAAAAKARRSSSGFVGTITDFANGAFGGNTTEDASRRALQRAAESSHEAEVARKAEAARDASQGDAGQFNFVRDDTFSFGNKALSELGRNVTEQAAARDQAIASRLAAQSQASTFLAPGSADVFSGRVAASATKDLTRSLTTGKAIVDHRDGANDNISDVFSNLDKGQIAKINEGVNKATADSIRQNGLEGKDLSKVDPAQLQSLADAAKNSIIASLQADGLTLKEIQKIMPQITKAAEQGVRGQLTSANLNSGKPLTAPQIQDLINTAPADSAALGKVAGVREALTGGLTSDQAGADIKAQIDEVQNRKDVIASTNPAADVSKLDEELSGLKLAAVNQAANQIHALGKLAESLLGPLDVGGRLQSQIDTAQKALDAGETGGAALADQAVVNQGNIAKRTRATVDAPQAAEALAVDPRSAVGGAKLALDGANRNLTDARAQTSDQTVLAQKTEAVRQAQKAYNDAVTSDANAGITANVALGDQIGALQAKYDTLINQANNEVGGQRAATLREAQQTLLDKQNAAADIAARQATASINPRDRIGNLQQDLTNTRNKVIAPADAGGLADQVRAERQLAVQIQDAQAAAAAAAGLAGVDPRDRLGNIRQQITNARNKPVGDAQGRAEQQLALNQLQLQARQENLAIANAREVANIFPGDVLGQARATLDSATRGLNAALRGTTEFYTALRAQKDAQVAYAAAVDAGKDVLRELSGDVTDPVFNANEAVRRAQEKLKRDRRLHADKNTTNNDELDIIKAQQAAQKSSLDQQLSLQATQVALHQESYTAYLGFLQKEDTSLRNQLKAKKKGAQGYQQLVDELNTVDQAILNVNKQLSGQFNLGAIKVPTVFEVRRAILTATPPAAPTGAASITPRAPSPQVNSSVTTNVQINGADLVQVKSLITSLIGPAAANRKTFANRKV